MKLLLIILLVVGISPSFAGTKTETFEKLQTGEIKKTIVEVSPQIEIDDVILKLSNRRDRIAQEINDYNNIITDLNNQIKALTDASK